MPKLKRHAWPKKKFLKTGPKLTEQDLRVYPAQLTKGLGEFLLWQNGGVPDLDTFVFDHPYGKNTVARVRSFQGISLQPENGTGDIAYTILCHWHDLPRGCVPIGDVDIEGRDFEVCTLLTFLHGKRSGRVYFFDNPHDCGPLDPDDSSRLTLLAKTLPSFVKSLRCHENYLFREVFRLSCSRRDLAELELALVNAGSDEFLGDPIESRKREVERYSGWEDQSTAIFLTSGASDMHWVPLPANAPAESCYLGINVSKWNRTQTLARLKSTLKSVPAWKGAKSIGRMSSDLIPSWRRL